MVASRSNLDDANPLSYLGENAIKSYVKSIRNTPQLDYIQPTPAFDAGIIKPRTILEDKNKHDISHSLVTKQWEGYVSEINDDMFVGVFNDKSNEEPFTAEFSLDDVAIGDRNLVRQGAKFTWAMGKEVKSWGQIKNDEVLIFKRLPSWKNFDISAPSAIVEEFNDIFDDSKNQYPTAE